MSGSLSSYREIFLRDLFLRVRARGIGARRPIGHDARAAHHVIADFDEQLRIARQPEIGARAEAHQSDAFAARNAISGFFPAHHAAGDEPGNLLEGDFARVGSEGDYVLLVAGGSRLAHRRGKFAGAILQVRDGTGSGRAIDVHVPDRQKNADALAGPAGVVLIGYNDDAAVRGGHYRAGNIGNDTFGIAEEVKDEGSQAEEDAASEIPAKKQGGCAEHEREQPEVVAFLDHASPTIPQQSRPRFRNGEQAWSCYDRSSG